MCALCAAVWSNIVYVSEGDVVEEYKQLYASQDLRLGHIALTAGLLTLSKG